MDGEFLLVSFEKNYEEYLIGMGMPGFVAKLVLSAKEVITYTEPKESASLWTIFTKTGKALIFNRIYLLCSFSDTLSPCERSK